MKTNAFIILLLSIFIGLTACDSASSTQTVNSFSSAVSDDSVSSANLQMYVPLIVGSEQGHLRGINLGDPITKVLANEKAILSEDSLDYKGFTLGLSDDDQEFADVLYYMDGKKNVRTINIDVFLNTPQATKTLLTQCISFYQQKLGEGKTDKNETVWILPDDVNFAIKDVSVSQAPGFRITCWKGALPQIVQ
jgi:hypothetical protein